MDMNLSKLQEIVTDRESWHAAVLGTAEIDKTEQLNTATKSLTRQWRSQESIFPSTTAIFEVCGRLTIVWTLSLFYNSYY